MSRTPATYRLRRRDDQALFGYNVGPQSWKKYLFPRGVPAGGRRTAGRAASRSAFAFIGVRACELRAIAIQDRVFTGGRHADPGYAANREGAFLVAVNCGQAGEHVLLRVDVGRAAGRGRLRPRADRAARRRRSPVPGGGRDRARRRGAGRGRRRRPRRAGDVAAADAVVERTTAAMERSMDPRWTCGTCSYDNLEHPRWDDVASRCLACANCTMVCPTCFCISVEDVTDLAGGRRGAAAVWDSCFTLDHSYLHGGPVRTSTRSRYRQWMTHKLATWTTSSAPRAASGADAASRGARSGSTSPRRSRDPADCRGGRLEPTIAAPRTGSSTGWTREYLALIAGCAAQRGRFSDGAFLFREGTRPRRSTWCARARSRWRSPRPAAGRHRADRRRGRGGRRSPGCSGRTAGSSTGGPSSGCTPSQLDGACLRGQVRRRPAARLRAHAAVRAARDRGGCRPPGCSCWTCTVMRTLR